MTPVVAESERVEGWKDIGRALGTCVRTAQHYAQRDYDPLPVRVGHRGPWAYVSALRDWVMRQDLPYQVAHRARAESTRSSRRARRVRARP